MIRTILSNRKMPWLIFALLLVFLFPGNAGANSAPVYSPPINSPLLPVMSTEIEVKNEQLTFTIEEEQLYKANVDVHYTFYNPTLQTTTLQVAFPYSGNRDTTHFQVTIDGVKLPSTSVVDFENSNRSAPFLETFQADKVIMVDPVTGEVNQDWQHDVSPTVQMVLFPLTFEARKSKEVLIHYEQSAGGDNVHYINPVKLYQYYLLPASAWKVFQHLHVKVITPERVYFAANLPLRKTAKTDGKNVWEGEFPSLPETNFAFSVMTQEGLLWNIASKDFYDVIGLLLITWISLVTTIFFTVKFQRNRFWWVRWLVGPLVTSIIVALSTILFIIVVITIIPAFSRSTWLGSYGVIFTPVLSFIFSGVLYLFISFIIKVFAILKRKGGD